MKINKHLKENYPIDYIEDGNDRFIRIDYGDAHEKQPAWFKLDFVWEPDLETRYKKELERKRHDTLTQEMSQE